MNESRIAVVTGGGTGIGAAVAHSLAQSCSAIVLVGRRQDRIDAVASELMAEHPGVTAQGRSVDLTDLDSVSAFIDWAHQKLPQVDVVVNNAGSPATPYRFRARVRGLGVGVLLARQHLERGAGHRRTKGSARPTWWSHHLDRIICR